MIRASKKEAKRFHVLVSEIRKNKLRHPKPLDVRLIREKLNIELHVRRLCRKDKEFHKEMKAQWYVHERQHDGYSLDDRRYTRYAWKCIEVLESKGRPVAVYYSAHPHMMVTFDQYAYHEWADAWEEKLVQKGILDPATKEPKSISSTLAASSLEYLAQTKDNLSRLSGDMKTLQSMMVSLKRLERSHMERRKQARETLSESILEMPEREITELKNRYGHDNALSGEIVTAELRLKTARQSPVHRPTATQRALAGLDSAASTLIEP